MNEDDIVKDIISETLHKLNANFKSNLNLLGNFVYKFLELISMLSFVYRERLKINYKEKISNMSNLVRIEIIYLLVWNRSK